MPLSVGVGNILMQFKNRLLLYPEAQARTAVITSAQENVSTVIFVIIATMLVVCR